MSPEKREAIRKVIDSMHREDFLRAVALIGETDDSSLEEIVQHEIEGDTPEEPEEAEVPEKFPETHPLEKSPYL